MQNTKATARVSIIIPVYNIELLISKCIESCTRQTFADLEIIIVNDGSTDGSTKIIEQYAEKDSRIKQIIKQNEGLSFARKTGIDNATGEYVFHLDGDDTITADAVESLYKQARLHNAEIAAGDVCVYKGNSVYQEKLYSQFGSGTGKAFLEFILINEFHYLWGKLIKRSLYTDNEIEIIKEVKVIGEDQMIMYQLCMFTNNVVTVKHVVYEYRINDNSITNGPIAAEQFTTHREYYAFIMHKLIKKFPYSDFIRQQINYRILVNLFLGLSKTGYYVVDRKKSSGIMRSVLTDAAFSNGSLIFKHFRLFILCLLSIISPRFVFKIKTVVRG